MLAKPAQLRKVRPIKHHDAFAVDEITSFMRDLRDIDGIGARCLEFVTLTAARSGEARGARWSEIDLAKAVWVIPGERMKAGIEHRVPLSRQAVTLLKKIPRSPEGDLVFRSPRGGFCNGLRLVNPSLQSSRRRLHASVRSRLKRPLHDGVLNRIGRTISESAVTLRTAATSTS